MFLIQKKKYSNNEQNCEYKLRSKQTSLFISAFVLIERKTSLFELQKNNAIKSYYPKISHKLSVE